MSPTDELRIDTPEQIALEIPIAGIGSRFLAIAVDTLLQVAASIALTLLIVVGAPAIGRGLLRLPAAVTSFLPAIGLFLLFCVYWGYFAVFEIFWQGQTPGKRVAGIRVIKDTGRPADVFAIVLRNLLRGIDLLPALYAVGVSSMLLTRHSRRVGDLVAGTVVVHDRPPARIEARWTEPAPAAASGLGASHVARLSDAELVVIETYLTRRTQVDWDARARTRGQIADLIAERTGLRPEPDQSLDDFLDAVARQARDAARYR